MGSLEKPKSLSKSPTGSKRNGDRSPPTQSCPVVGADLGHQSRDIEEESSMHDILDMCCACDLMW